MNDDLRDRISRRALSRERAHFMQMADFSKGTPDHALWCQIRDELTGYLAGSDDDGLVQVSPDQEPLFQTFPALAGGRDP